MFRLPFAALLISLALAAPAGAFQFDFARDGMLADIETRWASDYATPHKSLSIGSLTTKDGLVLTFEGTPLTDLSSRYGGTVQRFANAGYDTQWLCYTAAGQRIWYLTGGAPEEMNGGLVSWVLLEAAEPTHDAAYGCTAAPEAMLAASNGVPALGMSRAQVEELYDAELPEGELYVTLYQEADEEPYRVTNVTLRVQNDRVTGISMAEGEAY